MVECKAEAWVACRCEIYVAARVHAIVAHRPSLMQLYVAQRQIALIVHLESQTLCLLTALVHKPALFERLCTFPIRCAHWSSHAIAVCIGPCCH